MSSISRLVKPENKEQTFVMRIVSGEFKGRKILTPDGNNTRPTSDRVREAIFNLLAHNPDMPDVEGARVIDLFAGSGALGFEALSRGADFCLFVDIVVFPVRFGMYLFFFAAGAFLWVGFVFRLGPPPL